MKVMRKKSRWDSLQRKKAERKSRYGQLTFVFIVFGALSSCRGMVFPIRVFVEGRIVSGIILWQLWSIAHILFLLFYPFVIVIIHTCSGMPIFTCCLSKRSLHRSSVYTDSMRRRREPAGRIKSKGVKGHGRILVLFRWCRVSYLYTIYYYVLK